MNASRLLDRQAPGGARIMYLSDQPSPAVPLADEPDLLSVKDMKRLTGLSDQTIRAACASGQIPALKIGRFWFVPKAKLVEQMGCAR